MTPYEIYVFILCLIVFIALTVFFSFLIACIIKLSIKLIRAGINDEEIKKEYLKTQNEPKKSDIPSKIISIVICSVLIICFAFSLFMRFTEKSFIGNTPNIKVVKSSSMSFKHEKNVYLYNKNLNNQIGMMDIIVTHKLPSEEELKVFDIVVYEAYDGTMLVHRIIGIEEPNEEHPNERYFLLKGDANEFNDIFPVTYSQIRAIYYGERIPFIGSFIAFLQSPAGWLCILLVLFGIIAEPIVEKSIQKEEKLRLVAMGLCEGNISDEQNSEIQDSQNGESQDNQNDEGQDNQDNEGQDNQNNEGQDSQNDEGQNDQNSEIENDSEDETEKATSFQI